MPIIIPTVIAALAAGVAALAARAARREAAEREEAARREARRKAAERGMARSGHIRAAKQLITKHRLSITPERLVNLGPRGFEAVMPALNSNSAEHSSPQVESATVARLEEEVREVKSLIDVVERTRYP